MQTLFAVVYFCIAETCAMGWIDQPFDNDVTCTAYSQVYLDEMQKRAPESSAEMWCVGKDLLQSAREQFDMIEMKRLEDISKFRE